MQSTSAARFLSMHDCRAVQNTNCEAPKPSVWSYSGTPIWLSIGLSANGITAVTRSAFLSLSIAGMVGNGASITVKSRLSSRPCFFRPAFMAMSTPAPIEIGGEHLALEVLDRLDAGILADEELVREVAGHAVAETRRRSPADR